MPSQTFTVSSSDTEQSPLVRNLIPYQSAKEARRFRLKVGVYLVLMRSNEVLLSHRCGTGEGDGFYFLPAGCLEAGETVTEAMVREAKEEAGITIALQDLRVSHVMHRLQYMPDGSSFELIDFFFQPEHYEGSLTNTEPDKCDELKFYPLGNLPPTTHPAIRHAIECIRRGQPFSEFGW